MKFKHLIIAFTILIVFIILITVLLPLMLSRNGNAISLRHVTLPLVSFMVFLLTCMSIFFFFNYRLFLLLEREDWPALAYYLEQKVYVKGRYSFRNVRLLASSYLVISDFQSVLKLESKTLLAKSSLVAKNVLIFGAARILNGKHDESVAFFKSYLGKCGKNDKQWVRWFCGFSQLLGGAFTNAEPDFLSLAVTSDSILITGLSAYFLQNVILKYSLNAQKCQETAENGRERIRKAVATAENWKKEADKMEAEIHIAVIKKYIDSAGTWLFEEKTDGTVSGNGKKSGKINL